MAVVPRLNGARSAQEAPGLSHVGEAIHQEFSIPAARQRVFQTLTVAQEFDKLLPYSSVPSAPKSQMVRSVGGAFSLFGGHIVGIQLEIVPDERLVQAWRAADWAPGVYSIARFQLRDKGPGTLIVFDHVGFPNGEGRHLASGWYANYWTPLRRALG